MNEPVASQNKPYVLKTEPGTYAWCACGLSASQPFCDGSHRGTDLRPVVTHIDTEKSVAWCGCRQSQSKPFCDGHHKDL